MEISVRLFNREKQKCLNITMVIIVVQDERNGANHPIGHKSIHPPLVAMGDEKGEQNTSGKKERKKNIHISARSNTFRLCVSTRQYLEQEIQQGLKCKTNQ